MKCRFYPKQIHYLSIYLYFSYLRSIFVNLLTASQGCYRTRKMLEFIHIEKCLKSIFTLRSECLHVNKILQKVLKFVEDVKNSRFCLLLISKSNKRITHRQMPTNTVTMKTRTGKAPVPPMIAQSVVLNTGVLPFCGSAFTESCLKSIV